MSNDLFLTISSKRSLNELYSDENENENENSLPIRKRFKTSTSTLQQFINKNQIIQNKIIFYYLYKNRQYVRVVQQPIIDLFELIFHIKKYIKDVKITYNLFVNNEKNITIQLVKLLTFLNNENRILYNTFIELFDIETSLRISDLHENFYINFSYQVQEDETDFQIYEEHNYYIKNNFFYQWTDTEYIDLKHEIYNDTFFRLSNKDKYKEIVDNFLTYSNCMYYIEYKIGQPIVLLQQINQQVQLPNQELQVEQQIPIPFQPYQNQQEDENHENDNDDNHHNQNQAYQQNNQDEIEDEFLFEEYNPNTGEFNQQVEDIENDEEENNQNEHEIQNTEEVENDIFIENEEINNNNNNNNNQNQVEEEELFQVPLPLPVAVPIQVQVPVQIDVQIVLQDPIVAMNENQNPLPVLLPQIPVYRNVYTMIEEIKNYKLELLKNIRNYYKESKFTWT